MLQIIIYIFISFLVGILAIGKQGGFLLHFVLALLLTPVIGVIFALLSANRKVDRYAGEKIHKA